MDRQTFVSTTTWRGRRMYYYIGGVIGAVTILVILVLLIVMSLSSPCDLLKTEPSMRELLKNKKNFASSNDTSLANMIGYIYFLGKGYMPIILSKLDVSEDRVELSSNCATLTWYYEILNDNNGREISLSGMNLDVPKQGVIAFQNSTKPHCQLNSVSISYTSNFRFSCQDQMLGKCKPVFKDDGQTLIEIVFGSLELELIGDPLKIIAGEFSTKLAYPNSCEIFPASQDVLFSHL